jgi:pyruvate dehydrogenase E2 component (dihydrolipoamide acetyltransferase)
MAGEPPEGITPVVMPKWGLSMKEGTVVALLVAEGDTVEVGAPLMDVETDKLDGTVEAADAGTLRRLVAEVGRTYPVKGLLGVLAGPDVPDDEVDAFIAGYVVPEADEEDGADSAYRFVEVAGIRVRYARQGEGDRTVVLLHGFGGDLDNWLFNLGPLTQRAEVVALDLPGHGQSDLVLPGATLGALAAFVVAFLDELGLDAVDLVGHSLGGAIASQVALDQPGRVTSVALLAPAGLGPEIDADYLDGFVRATSKRELKPVLGRLFADEGLVNRSLVDGVLRYKRLDGVDALLAELREGVFPGGQQAALPGRRLGETPVRVLVVWGAADQVIPSAHAAHAPAGATVAVLDEAGHMVQMEKASDVNELLARHLDS